LYSTVVTNKYSIEQVSYKYVELSLPWFDNFMAANMTFGEHGHCALIALCLTYIACSSNLLHGLTAFYFIFYFFDVFCVYIYTLLLLSYE